jgi:hypothetical protein
MLILASSVCGLFKWRQFEPEVILLAVGWYLRFFGPPTEALTIRVPHTGQAGACPYRRVLGRNSEGCQESSSYQGMRTVGTTIKADGTRNGRSLKSCCLLKRQVLVHDSNKKIRPHYLF